MTDQVKSDASESGEKAGEHLRSLASELYSITANGHLATRFKGRQDLKIYTEIAELLPNEADTLSLLEYVQSEAYLGNDYGAVQKKPLIDYLKRYLKYQQTVDSKSKEKSEKVDETNAVSDILTLTKKRVGHVHGDPEAEVDLHSVIPSFIEEARELGRSKEKPEQLVRKMKSELIQLTNQLYHCLNAYIGFIPAIPEKKIQLNQRELQEPLPNEYSLDQLKSKVQFIEDIMKDLSSTLNKNATRIFFGAEVKSQSRDLISAYHRLMVRAPFIIKTLEKFEKK